MDAERFHWGRLGIKRVIAPPPQKGCVAGGGALLADALRQRPQQDVGDAMPPGGGLPPATSDLVRTWIEEGAEDTGAPVGDPQETLAPQRPRPDRRSEV